MEEKVESEKAKGQRGSSAAARQPSVITRSSPSRFLLYTLAFLLLAALLPIRLFEVANPDWRPLSWIHALTVVGYSLLVIGYWGGWPAVRHFAFPVCFILVAVPWPTPIEGPLVNGLMRLVAAIATETLTLFGIPAQLEGSLIRTANGVVGVSEACSGVRSLQTSLMIGLLFGELKRLTTGRRFALVAAALTIALVANFGRTIFLVWIAATENLAAVERWHDFAGYAIVGAVFLGTLAMASALAKVESGKGKGEGDSGAAMRRPVLSRSLPSTIFFLSTLAFLLCAEGAVSAWYRWHERNFVSTTGWDVRWPEEAPGFKELPIAEHIRSTLRYNSGREAMWRFDPVSPEQPPGLSGNWTLFFFRWEPGSASLLRARAHRPDICLPSAGWVLTNDEGVRNYRAAGDLALPFRHFRFVRRVAGQTAMFANAFFCQREDRVPPGKSERVDVTAGRPGSWLRSDRVRIVRAGLRNQGQQVMEAVLITPNEMKTEAAETEFAQLARSVIRKK